MHLYTAKYHIHLSDWYIFLHRLSFKAFAFKVAVSFKKKVSLCITFVVEVHVP